MITKTQFFALLNDKENQIGATAHIAVYHDANGNASLIISQRSAPNAWLSNHVAHTTTIKAFNKYNAWLNEWFTAQAVTLEEARVRNIEADRKAGRPVDEEGNDTREWSGNSIAADHAEALLINADIDVILEEAEDMIPVQEAGDVNWIFWTAERIWLRRDADRCHEEALAINEAMDAGLNEEWALKVGAKEISLADALGGMDTDTECAAMEVSPAMQRYTIWLDRAKQNGTKLVAWKCPACDMQLHGLYPASDREEWDSATMCPSCNHLYYKITRYGEDGKGSVELRAV